MTTPTSNTGWRRWRHFWFAPADPTGMAFLRVVTGLLVLYTHLAYSFDLSAFFGAKGWYGLDQINRERREMPWTNQPFFDGWKWWEETARFPEEPHRRQALLAYTRALPTDRAGVDRALAVLAANVPAEPNGYPPAVGQAAADYVSKLSDDPLVRANALKALAKELPRGASEVIPPAFDALAATAGDAALKKLAADLAAFHATLPQAVKVDGVDTADTWARKRQAAESARKFVCESLVEMDEIHRYNFLNFARDLAPWPTAEARAAATDAERARADAERAKKLDYFRYWNIEKRYVGSSGNPIFSLWFHISTPTEMAVAHVVMLTVMLLFTLGLFTRVTAVLTWLSAVSYIHRNQQVLFGQDTMMNILLLYLMISNCGAALSLDRLIARYRAAKGSLRRCGHIDGPTAAFLAAPPPSVAAGFAQRLLQVHFCFIYMASGLSKLKGADWWNTGAFWSTMGNPEFTLLHYEWYRDLLRWMVTERVVYATMAAFFVGFTFVVEIGLPFLVWTKLRPHIVIGGFLLHFGIGVFMGLLIFSLLMMTMLASYLPGAVIRRQLFGTPPPDKDRVRLTVDPASDADVARVAWAVARDTAGKIEVVKR